MVKNEQLYLKRKNSVDSFLNEALGTGEETNVKEEQQNHLNEAKTIDNEFYKETELQREDGLCGEDDLLKENSAYQQDNLLKENSAYQQDNLLKENNAYQQDNLLKENGAYQQDNLLKENSAYQIENLYQEEGLYNNDNLHEKENSVGESIIQENTNTDNDISGENYMFSNFQEYNDFNNLNSSSSGAFARKRGIRGVVGTFLLRALDVFEEIEIYQVLGIMGCFLMLAGCFKPALKIECGELYGEVGYFETEGIFVVLLSIASLALIFINKHKYCIIPATLIMAENIALLLAVSEIKQYIFFQSGYYWVWTGAAIVLVSAFLINSGYAKDSGLMHNKPIYFKDIIWICIAVVGATLFANYASKGGYIAAYAEKIESMSGDDTVSREIVRVVKEMSM